MSFSVNANMYLRNCYATTNRSLCVKSNRKDFSDGTLSFADASALKRSIHNLQNFNYSSTSSDDNKENVKLTYNLKSFIDSYNYTLDSGKKSSQEDITSAVKNLKRTSSKFSKELKRLGISFDKDGYMSISSSATKNIKPGTYEEMFGEGSDYLKELNRYSSRITSRVDVRL